VDGDGTPRPTRFAADFRRIVIPTLTREINRLAPDVADGQMAFSDAMAELTRLAYQRGAGYLSEGLRDELVDWVAQTLLEETDLAEEAEALVQSLLREPSRDVIRAAIRKFLDDG
jgi:hypothetical protein